MRKIGLQGGLNMRPRAWFPVFVVTFSLVSLTAAGLAAATDANANPPPRGVVYLDKSLEWEIATGEDGHKSRLVREFFRQAFLIAARDELRLTTRDAWLGDPMPSEGDAPPFDLKTQPVPGTPLQVFRGFPPNAKVVKRYELKLRGDLPYLVTQAEKLSRTKFVEALRAAGFSGKANAWKADAPLPDGIENLLVEMNFISQFQAVRELHEAIHSGGESPALLGGLVRGYANLGLLTEYLWHPEHKVFKARALLYAQRMVVRGEHSAQARWHRAYARSLVGLHKAALEDLDAAEKEAKTAAGASDRSPPAWAPLLRAYCHYDLDRLSAGKRRRRRPSWPDCWRIVRPNLPTTRR